MSEEQPKPKKRRGFAVMDPEKLKEIATSGGRAAHAHGNGHEWSHAEAKVAGRKGGFATANKKRVAKGLPPLTEDEYAARDAGAKTT